MPLVTVEGTAQIPILRLTDPDRRNALSVELSGELEAAVTGTLAEGAQAIVLTADPPVFCAGGSLDDLALDPVPLDDIYRGFLALAGAPVPTIAAVNGAAIGAGVNLPLACDVIVTSPSASFDPRFLDVGIHPGGGHLWRLQRRVGTQTTAAMVLLGEQLGGEEAAARGLAWRCVDDDELLPRCLALAERAASRDDDLVRRTKASIRRSEAILDDADAVALEREAQRWAVTRPAYAATMASVRRRLGR